MSLITSYQQVVLSSVLKLTHGPLLGAFPWTVGFLISCLLLLYTHTGPGATDVLSLFSPCYTDLLPAPYFTTPLPILLNNSNYLTTSNFSERLSNLFLYLPVKIN